MRLLFLALVLACSSPAIAGPKIQEVVSPGGIRAWLVESHAVPIVALRAGFTEAGSAHDPAGLEGRAAMTASLLEEGAGEMNALAFTTALENDAIGLNLSADEDQFTVSLQSLSEKKSQAFRLLGLALTSPRFDEDAIARLKIQTLTTLQELQESPNYALERAWAKLAYADHPYGRPPATPESMQALNRADFVQCHQRYLTKENLLISVAGDITAAELMPLLDAAFSQLPARYQPDQTVAEHELPKQSARLDVERDIPQTLVMFGTPGLKRQDPDYLVAYMLNYIIGGDTLSSRLGKTIRGEKGLAYYASSHLQPQAHSASWIGIFATRTEKAGEAIKAMQDTLALAAEKGISDKELIDAKAFLTGSFVLSLDSNAELANFLLTMQRYQLGIDYLDRRNALISAVTKTQINAMAKRLLISNRQLLATIGKKTP